MKGLITKLDSLFLDKLDGKRHTASNAICLGLVFDDYSNCNEHMNRIIDTAVKMRDVFKKYLSYGFVP